MQQQQRVLGSIIYPLVLQRQRAPWMLLRGTKLTHPSGSGSQRQASRCGRPWPTLRRPRLLKLCEAFPSLAFLAALRCASLRCPHLASVLRRSGTPVYNLPPMPVADAHAHALVGDRRVVRFRPPRGCSAGSSLALCACATCVPPQGPYRTVSINKARIRTYTCIQLCQHATREIRPLILLLLPQTSILAAPRLNCFQTVLEQPSNAK